MEFENLVCVREGRVLTVSMNRPEKLNALSPALLRDLGAAARLIADDASIRAAVLTGNGRGFCAGADLTDPSARPLALVGDITLAARSAKFAILFAPKLGLVPDMGATHFLPARIGIARARHLALTGEAIDAEHAERIGLIAEVVDDGQLSARAQSLAAQLADGPTQAFIAVRNLMNGGGVRTLEEQVDLEATAQSRLADTADFAEGLTAFRDKRAPRFVGR